MQPVPATNLRNNLGTWAVPTCNLPAVASYMQALLKPEQFDPSFMGQYLQTTYFDTQSRDLRKARVPKKRYITLRIRSYHAVQSAGLDATPGRYAVSAKTEDQKHRFDINLATAQALMANPTMDLWATVLTPDLLARAIQMIDDRPLMPVVTVCAHRYATEDPRDRLTLDVDTCTDTGKRLPYAVLEFKSIYPDPPPGGIAQLPGVRPIKSSKFLWATQET